MNLNLKLLIFGIIISLFNYAQETNCADGIDNDGDGQIDINDTDCQCNGGTTTITSFIPNPSFENNSSCPTALAEMSKANNWNQASGGTIDYFACGFTRDTYSPPPSPPHGTAYVGAIYHNTEHGTSQEWHEYLWQCLQTTSNSLSSGTNYTLNFDMIAARGLTSPTNNGSIGTGTSNTSVQVGVYGKTGCGSMPFSGQGVAPGTWTLLTTVNANLSTTTWSTLTATFTPSITIDAIMLGPTSVDNMTSSTGIVTVPAQAAIPPFIPAVSEVRTNYYYLDNLILNATTAFSSPTSTITSSGTYCGGNLTYSFSTSSSSSSRTSYQWYKDGIAINGATNASLNVSSMTNGVYSQKIIYADGNCSISNGITLTVPTLPTANAGSNVTTTCTTPTRTLNGSGGVSYSWSPSTGLSNANIANPVANPSSTTSYTLTVTAANGCTDTDNVTVTVNETAPSANAGSNKTVTCSNTSRVLNGSGGGSYSWSPSTGLSNANIASPTASPSSTTVYTLTVTGSNGCTDTDNATITVNTTAPTANAGSNQTVTCTSPSTALSGSGGVGYSWSPSAGLSNANVASPTATPSSTTTYTLTVTGSNGCTDTDNVTVTVNGALPTANAGSNVTTTCTTPTRTLNGSGGVSYSWSPSSGLSNANIANPVANPSSTTSYTLTVTAANGCTDTDNVTVTVNESAPSANAGSNKTVTCSNTSRVLNGSGGGSYSWSPSTGLSNANIASPTASPSSTTVYTLTVTGSNGCTATDNATITVNTTAPTANAGSNQTVTCTSPSTTLSGSGGASYSWSPSAGLSNANIASPTATPSTTTTYTLTVTGSNGCTDTDNVTVTVNGALPTANAGSDVTTDCTTPTTVLSGSGGGTYNWSPSAGLSNSSIANPTADPSATTTYTLTVTAPNGCTHSDDVVVTVDETISANAGSDLVLSCTTPSGTINASGLGGAISWSPTTGLSDPTIINPVVTPVSSPSTVTYTLTVTGPGNGCVATDDVNVSITGSIPTITVSPNATIDCNVLTAPLTASGGDSYSWSPNTNLSNTTGSSIVATPSVTTTYIVVGTNSAGCSGSAQVTVTVDSIFPIVDAGLGGVITCTTPSPQLTATSTGNFLWSGPGIIGGNNTATISVDETGYYFLSSTGTNGCTSIDSSLVTVDTLSPVITDLSQLNFYCAHTGGEIESVVADTQNVHYNWTTSDGVILGSTTLNQPFVGSEGVYYLILTNDNGCFTIDSIQVSDSSGLLADFTPSLDSGTIDFTVDFTNTSMGNELTYEWFIDGVSLSSLVDEQETFTSEGDYEVMLIAIDSSGCADSVSHIIKAVEDLGIVIPGIFTPGDGNGANDFFEILNIDKFPENKLQIFSRWGDKVYEAEPYNNDWDGTNQVGGVKPLGEELVEGTYFYILYTEPTAKVISGYVELLRD